MFIVAGMGAHKGRPYGMVCPGKMGAHKGRPYGLVCPGKTGARKGRPYGMKTFSQLTVSL